MIELKRMSFLDKLVYRVFFWQFNDLLKCRPDLRELLISQLKTYDVLDDGEEITIKVSIEKRNDD